jgi:hypothetical protein
MIRAGARESNHVQTNARAIIQKHGEVKDLIGSFLRDFEVNGMRNPLYY